MKILYIIQSFLKEFYKSKNKVYFILRYKGILSALSLLLTIITGMIGFYKHQEGINRIHELFDAFFHSLSLLGLDFPTGNELTFFTITASIFATITISLVAVLLFFKEQINQRIFKELGKQEHIAFFGLGQIARSLLKTNTLSLPAIIIEKDSQYAEEYREKGFGVKIGDAFDYDFLKNSLRFDTMRYALIAFGEDKLNIEFAKKILSIYKEKDIKTPIKLIVHIGDKNLSALFNKEFMFANTDKSKKIHLKTFSYFEECAVDLFEKHMLDGNTLDYMKTANPLHTVIVGDGELLRRIVYKICSLSHFPNQNIHTITIIDTNAQKLLLEIMHYINYGIDTNNEEKFPTLKLNAITANPNIQEFYELPLWKDTYNLENIIVCYDDENKNITISTTLYEKLYLADALDKKKVPKIIMGIFNDLELSTFINEDTKDYTNLYTFGSKSNILKASHLLDEETDNIAQLIHYGYANDYQPQKLSFDLLDIEQQWYDTTRLSDKLSNIAQARHIDMKLKALGLKRKKSNDFKQIQQLKKELYTIQTDIDTTKNKNKKKKLLEKEKALKTQLEKTVRSLLNTNKKTLYKALKDDAFPNEKEIIQASTDKKKFFKIFLYLDNFDKNLFYKLIRTEHNRWNAYHYLNGWQYAPEKNKAKKQHNCLLPIEKFDKEQLTTIIYDAYSFLYLPNYLAQSGYEIKHYS